MLSKKKKIIILVSLVILLVCTGGLNVWLNKVSNTKSDSDQIIASSNFYEMYRADRLEVRNERIGILDAIISSEASSKDSVSKAEAEKIEVSKLMEKELRVEGLIKALGYKDCVVTMSSSTTNVIVKSEKLESNQVAQILDTVVKETGMTPTGIRVLNVE